MYTHTQFYTIFLLQELKETIAEELDFEHEAQNLEQCGRDLRDLPYVYVPRVNWDLTTKRVLTAEWINGCKASDKEGIERLGLNVADVSV